MRSNSCRSCWENLGAGFRSLRIPFTLVLQLSSNLQSDPEIQKMPPLRSARNRKPPPDGFDDIEDTLLEFANKMKDAENASHEGKKRHEVLWSIFQISHQRRSFPSLEDTVTHHLSEFRLKIYLRPILRQRSHIQAAIRMAT